jgi:hypothetical protein
MDKVVIIPINVIDHTQLPETTVSEIPTDGDPLEINGEMYYVCETVFKQQHDFLQIGVIPLVVRNPSKVLDIKNYIGCLSLAHRKVKFKNANGICDLDNCDEMVIS